MLVATPILLIVFCYPKIPVAEISSARAALSLAGREGADIFATKDYMLAESLWDLLMAEWKKQNNIFFLKRDYSNLFFLANRIVSHAEKAIECTVIVKKDVRTAIEIDLDKLSILLTKLETKFKKLPLNKSLYQDISRARILYSEGIRVFERKEYIKAQRIIAECLELSESCENSINQTLIDYFQEFPQWEELRKNVIKYSRKNHCSVVLVDKFAHKCYVYNKGNMVSEFNVEFGPNWIGDKNYTGDKATPEGKYFITKKLGPKQTKYYKALLINYPNEDDKKRYNEALRNGSIPGKKGIGGLIEIHGGGGKGVNWTDGCIALENKNMDYLFKMVTVNTPVVIVGSINPLHQILE